MIGKLLGFASNVIPVHASPCMFHRELWLWWFGWWCDVGCVNGQPSSDSAWGGKRAEVLTQSAHHLLGRGERRDFHAPTQQTQITEVRLFRAQCSISPPTRAFTPKAEWATRSLERWLHMHVGRVQLTEHLLPVWLRMLSGTPGERWESVRLLLCGPDLSLIRIQQALVMLETNVQQMTLNLEDIAFSLCI